MKAAGKVLAYVAGQSRADGVDRRGARADLLQGQQRPRLQVQLGGAGGLPERVARRGAARYLASSVFNLRGKAGADNTLVQRTRAALA